VKIYRAYKYLSVTLIATILIGCTSVKVRMVDPRLDNISHICIKDNPRVIVDDFVSVIEDKFMEHGISSEVFEGRPPDNCIYVLTYTARQSWDIATFLKYAEIKIRKNRKIIGSAIYKHGGGLALNKWHSTKDKMGPVIDKLLEKF